MNSPTHLLPLLLLLLTLHHTTCTILPNILIRSAEPGDIVDTFTLQTSPSTDTCPSTIQHTSYNQSSNEFVYKVPHESILQEGIQCNNFSYLTLVKDEAVLNEGLVGDEEADTRDNIKIFMKNSSLIIGGGRKLKDDGVEWWGLVEFQTRVCENLRKFRVGTVGMLIKESDKDVEIEGVGMLEGGKKWLVVRDDGTERTCVYEGAKSVDDKVEEPMNSASPSPAASLLPGETPVVDEEGNVVGVGGEDDEEDDEENESPDGDDDEDSDGDGEGAECFPGDVVVDVEGGSKFMRDVVVGDKVRVGKNEFSEVFMFTHKIQDGSFEFVKIETESGNTLHLSKGHYLYVNSQLMAAKSVVAGDNVQLASGMMTKVASVSCEHREGLYNPQTMHGDIVVNGILASTYTTAVEPSVAHKLLAPMRFVYSHFGIASSALESGGGLFTRFMPSGSSVVA